MKLRSFGSLALTSCALLTLGTSVSANMGNSPSTYGLLPGDIASAQALSIFNSQISAVYYNPANLAKDPRGELTGGIFHADHDLQANGSTIMDEPSQQLQLGLKTDLSSISTLEHPLYFGLMVGVEKFAQEMMAFSSETSDYGQYFTYGRQPLFLTAGAGTSVWRGIDVGFALRVTLHADATLNTRSTLGGVTSQESLNVSAAPKFRPILGVNINWGETFCSRANCWMDNLETAISYRAYSNTRTKVRSNVIVPGTIPAPGLDLAIKTLDSFQPAITAVGVKYDFGTWRLGVTGEYQAWSRLEREFRDDTIKDQANANFKDIFIPRIGIEVPAGDHFTFTGGIAWEETPIEGKRSLDVNYLDADRWVVGLGMSAIIPKMPLLAYPVRMDLGYQYQQLDNKTYELTSTNPLTPPGVYGEVETDGEVHVFAASVTLKF
ncbi:OmpP1/FadL family transporter [Alcanivorax sp. S71-1-4]|uniref:OmpP1/FadL family transporter n=1 Tax=Alcanivorax sp. S71-1-4 TaxID=1177159 RepID=UPI00135AC159|nr:aromatic hydrocarbon degradation protein [Alcanivorax sp. S71-1-4]